jgi:hypothetical protein
VSEPDERYAEHVRRDEVVEVVEVGPVSVAEVTGTTREGPAVPEPRPLPQPVRA